jgi:uncharacterized protein YxeA
MNKTVVRMCIFHILLCIILALSTFMWNDNYGNYSFYLNIREPHFQDDSTDKNEIELKTKIEDFDGQGTKSSTRAV